MIQSNELPDNHLPDGRIHAPFTPQQVKGLNEWQACGWVHPFTCGNRGQHPDNEGILIAAPACWRCPACDYVQFWAHDFMAKGAPPNPLTYFAGPEPV